MYQPHNNAIIRYKGHRMTTEVKFKDLNRERYTSMRDWCKDQFGANALWPAQLNAPNGPVRWYTQGDYPKEIYGMKSETGAARFVFREDRDATLFSLRWSEKD